MEAILDLLKANPAYLGVAVVLAIIILFGVVKKLFKILLIGVALLVIYIAYLVWAGEEVSVKRLTKDLESAREKVIEGTAEKVKEGGEKIIKETLK